MPLRQSRLALKFSWIMVRISKSDRSPCSFTVKIKTYQRHSISEKKHKLHFRERRENPKAWFFGNREGQISIVVDDNTPIPLIEQQLTIRSVSPESPPTRFGIRSGRRTLRSRRSLAKEDSDDNDDNDTIGKC